MLNEELEPLGLWVSWVKTKIQAFNDILDAAILSVPVCGEDAEVVQRFTYFSSDIHAHDDSQWRAPIQMYKLWKIVYSVFQS